MARWRTGSTVAAGMRALRLVARASPRQFATAAALQVVGAIAALALVYAAKVTIDALLSSGRSPTGGLVVALVILAVATALSGAVGTLQAQQQRLLAEDVSTDTWQELLAVTSRVPMEWMDSPTFVERSERLQGNALSRPLAIATASLVLVGSAITVVALSVAVLAIEPLLVPVLLLAGLPTVLLSERASRTEKDFVRTWTQPYRLRNYYRTILSTQAFAKEVRAFQLQREIERRHLSLSDEYRAGLTKQVRTRQLYGLAGALVTAFVLALALAAIVWFVLTDRMTLSDAGAAVVAVRLLSGALSRAFGSLGSIVESSIFLSELHEFLAEAPLPLPDLAPQLPLRSVVSLERVGFRYPETERDVLLDIDLVIEPGQFVALVGENGSGKSTLAKVVAGLYSPTSGDFRWDGQTVDEQLRESVRRSVSVILQDYVEYDLTVADNIDLSEERDVERLRGVMQAAKIEDVVAQLPRGLDTVLGRSFEGAVDLSGGQWQRVALARALARDAPLLVLDEPSSALDPRTEHELFADLRAVAGRRAILLVSHRYANLHLADRIVVLQDGVVVDSGTHDELISREGLYAQLYGMQAGSYRTR